jgi:hypothetical protein
MIATGLNTTLSPNDFWGEIRYDSDWSENWVSGDRLNRLKEKLRDYLKKNHRAD